MKEEARESNFELLRLVCMCYILLHHFIVHGLRSGGYFEGDEVNAYSLFFNSFFVIAVNCFVLISGYFGIKASWKGFTHLYILCVFYILGILVIKFVAKGYFDISEFFYSLLPFSHSPYWFITSYFYLYLFSPIINKAIDNMTKQNHIAAIGVLALLSFYFGFAWRNNINNGGYNVVNFIFLYFIARFIALYVKNENVGKRRKTYFWIYLINSLFVALIALLVYYSPIEDKYIPIWAYAYNSPFVIASSIAFFLLFRTFNIKSKYVNRFAQSALAIYLIHENPYIKAKLYRFIHTLSEQLTDKWLLIVIFPVLALAVMVICVGIDRVRIAVSSLIEEKILNRVDVEKYFTKAVNAESKYFS